MAIVVVCHVCGSTIPADRGTTRACTVCTARDATDALTMYERLAETEVGDSLDDEIEDEDSDLSSDTDLWLPGNSD